MLAERLHLDVQCDFPGFRLEAAQSIDLSGATAIFGPSGAGKSTLLRLIAGLLKPQKGRIRFGDDVWCDTDAGVYMRAHERPAGLVFQDGRLFPHLTVDGNLLYAERRAGARAGRHTLQEIIDAFDLRPLLERRPASLSGGERQRVALARTLLARPALLLLDEPLSALDQSRKADIFPYLDDLSERFAVPVLYVSHNVDEVARIAERTIILSGGRIEASGSTAEVMTAYGLASGPEGGGAGVIMAGAVIDHDEAYGLSRVAIGGGVISLPINKQQPAGAPVNIRVEARNVAIALSIPKDISIRNILPAIIETVQPCEGSPFTDVALRVNGALLRAQITRAASDDLSLAPGLSVYALIKTASFAA